MSPQDSARRHAMRPSATIEVMSYGAPYGLGALGLDHTFVVITDNQTGEKWVARGGPDQRGLGAVDAKMRGDLLVAGEVKPWRESTEFGVLKHGDRPVRRLHSTLAPGVTGSELAALAADEMGDLNAARRPYGAKFNSNSIASHTYERLTGRRFTGRGLLASRSDMVRGIGAGDLNDHDTLAIEDWMKQRAAEVRQALERR